MGQKSTIFRVSRFVTHIPKRKVSQNLNTLMRNYPLLVYKAFPLTLEPGFCSFCSSCPIYGETKIEQNPRFVHFVHFVDSFGEHSPLLKTAYLRPKWTKPGFCSFCSFCWFDGGAKMNKTSILFILFIFFILLGNMFPFKNSIFSKKWLKPGFCSFCSFCWFDGGAKNEQNPRFCSFCSFCSFFWGTCSPLKTVYFRKNDWNPGFVHFVRFVDLVGGGQEWTTPGFCSFCSFCSFFLGTLEEEAQQDPPMFPKEWTKWTKPGFCSFLPPPPNQQNKQNEQNPGFSHFCEINPFLQGRMFPQKWTKWTPWTKPGFCSFLAPPIKSTKRTKWTKPWVLAIFRKLSLFYRGNVPQKNEQNEQNEQNPGFVHFWLPPQINKTNKMNKTRVLAIFVKLTLFTGENVPPKKEQMNKTRVLFIFAPPIKSTKRTKWTKPGFQPSPL